MRNQLQSNSLLPSSAWRSIAEPSFCVHTFPKLYFFEIDRENIRDLHTNMRFLSSCWRINKQHFFCAVFVMVTIANLPSCQAFTKKSKYIFAKFRTEWPLRIFAHSLLFVLSCWVLTKKSTFIFAKFCT